MIGDLGQVSCQGLSFSVSWKYACWKDEMGWSTHSTYVYVSESDMKPQISSRAKWGGQRFALYLLEHYSKEAVQSYMLKNEASGCRQQKVRDTVLAQQPPPILG